MKTIFFDSSTLISMATACTLEPFVKLQKDFGGDFAITPAVKAETIDKALTTLRFKYEGIRLNKLLKSGVIKLYPENKFKSQINELLELINNTYFAWGHPLKIVHLGEISALAVALGQDAVAYAVDERTTRILIESPEQVAQLLQSKLHTNVDVNKGNLKQIEDNLKGLPVIRSTELALAAFEKGYFGDKTSQLLEGVLWALKINGCAIGSNEIRTYVQKLTK